ncbi:MAG: carbon-nitrogen hydrolase family protein [Verrucomicrobiota bacterium]
MNVVKVAACQLPYVHQDVDRALAIILRYAGRAESRGAKLICFPECYLQGYVYEGENTEDLALDLSSPAFDRVAQVLEPLTSTLVFGLIERDGANLFNTAVVMAAGTVVGRYRKAKLQAGERQFEAGNTFPVFDLHGLRFGINICYDLNFSECAQAVSKQKAQLLLCPCNNMMRRAQAEHWKLKHNEIRGHRALESGLCIISSDVTGEWNDRISYGPTAVIDENGLVSRQAELMQNTIVFHEVKVEQGETAKPENRC